MKIITKIINTNNLTGEISIDNLVATSEDITNVIEEVAKKQTINYKHLNNIYTFALDL